MQIMTRLTTSNALKQPRPPSSESADCKARAISSILGMLEWNGSSLKNACSCLQSLPVRISPVVCTMVFIVDDDGVKEKISNGSFHMSATNISLLTCDFILAESVFHGLIMNQNLPHFFSLHITTMMNRSNPHPDYKGRHGRVFFIPCRGSRREFWYMVSSCPFLRFLRISDLCWLFCPLPRSV